MTFVRGDDDEDQAVSPERRPWSTLSPAATVCDVSCDADVRSIDYARCAHELRALEAAVELGDLARARVHLQSVLQTFAIPREPAEPSRRLPNGAVLTAREAVILRRLPDGSMSQKDIARELGVTRNTVKTHLKSLYLKLGVHCRGEAIHQAREMGLLLPVPPLRHDDTPLHREAV
jgi:DNA-binding CsgD family transcriptional regulator